ncbi:midasin-like [Coffea arabica]|uniref:Midasin-like n=1 Tax=Coffea arabica TaxID=13443 RepID=A0A6P6VWP7_COFAR|nr:midasin-like [Coffea arabica]
MYCLFTWMSKWMEKHCLEVMFVQSKEQPGEFRWQPGSVTQDICNGFWVVVEDVDKASPDVQSILLPLLEGASSFITGHGEAIRVHKGFRLFATVTSSKLDISSIIEGGTS